MTKGKSWPVDDERLLRDWYKSGTTNLGVLAFSFNGRYSEDAIRQKLIKLQLVEAPKLVAGETWHKDEIVLPDELPSVEEALKVLVAALRALDMPGLSSAEISRLRSIISGVNTYKELLADYMDYRGIEIELLELRDKYERLAKRPDYNVPKYGDEKT